jgi:subtilisin-like proprotein convertase family protein
MKRRHTAAIAAALTAALASVAALNPPAAVAAPTTLAVSNTASISPPDNFTSGTASQITVAGQTGLVTDLDVTLNGFSSTYPDDLDILLKGPNGRAVMLMSDRCGGDDVSNLTIRFDDEASAPASDEGPCISGSFWPSDGVNPDDPGFQAPNALALSAFDAASPNGAWTLHVADDDNPDAAVILGGFTLTFQLSDEAAPVVTFGKVPKPSTKTTVKVPFTADDAGSTFECNLDGVGWNPCKSPAKLKKLSVGKHKFSVRATDPSGNLGAPARTKVKVLPKD